ncbi:uncharacterized protein LOC114257013 [Camellia sinensis]|uniref:uncharacterized protein LOC114257013 n=1 Tax=Camellia sinensis TaxID=4442 RepID=UPI00103630D5|nr:uncharacterized protein LOC114257013 [Camellia sinensis]
MTRDCTQIEQQKGRKLAISSTGSILKPGNTARPVATRDTMRQGRVFALVPGDTWNTEAIVSGNLSVKTRMSPNCYQEPINKEFNMRQRRWLEPIKDYDLQIQYHLGKANTIVDALSRKSIGSLACLLTKQKEILQDFEKSEIEVISHEQNEWIAAISVEPTIINEIKQKQKGDEVLKKIVDEFETNPKSRYSVENEVLKFQNRLCVPNIPERGEFSMKPINRCLLCIQGQVQG